MRLWVWLWRGQVWTAPPPRWHPRASSPLLWHDPRTGSQHQIWPHWSSFLEGSTFIYHVENATPQIFLPTSTVVPNFIPFVHHSFIWCLLSPHISSSSAFSANSCTLSSPSLWPPSPKLLNIFTSQPFLAKPPFSILLGYHPILLYSSLQSNFLKVLPTYRGLHFFSPHSLTSAKLLFPQLYRNVLPALYCLASQQQPTQLTILSYKHKGVLTFLPVPSPLQRKDFACSLNPRGLS